MIRLLGLTRLTAVVIVAAVLSLILGCRDTGKVYRIGVSQCSDDDWRKKMNEEILREMMFHDNAVVEIRSADDSNDKQIADLRYFAENDFDIIIAAPNEADALTPVISEIYESGMPVLLFDRGIHGDSFTSFQGADNLEVGRSAAQLIYSMTGGDARILEIRGLKGSTPAEERHAGFLAVTDSVAGMTVVGSAYGNWNATDAAVAVDSLLRVHSEANVLYAHNDRMAIAASQVVRAAGRDDIKIIGIDAAPEIGVRAVADSVIDATFLYPTEGSRLIRTAIDILSGNPVQRIVKLPAASVVDRSNAEILLLQNEELKEEAEKIAVLKEQVEAYWLQHSAQTSLLYAAIVIVVLMVVLSFMLLRAYWLRRQHQMRLAEQNHQLELQRDQVIELNRQLREATQSKLMFFTNVSHDLRTPLTLIAAPIEQLLDADNMTPVQKAMVKLANKNLRILTRLTNQILDFRKYENGKLDMTLSEVDLTGMMNEWCESFESIAVSRDIRFSTDFSLADVSTVAVDIDKIERVMFNLISNAFKYTPSNGEITVEMKHVGDNVEIVVADTGKGISADDLPHIFERFFQVDKINPNGSGIGLALAKAFVEMHGGTLVAESRQGKGSRFVVTLPIKHVGGDVVTTGSRITSENVRLELENIVTEPSSADNDKTTVLVIDDNRDIRQMLTMLLGEKYRVLTASNGYNGLKMAAKYIPDLIICDVMMPVMDGMECCRSLKAEQSTSHIPVLLLTACSMDEQRVRGYECGADGYLSKPFSADVLMARCEALIDNRRRIQSLWPSSKTANTAHVIPDHRLTADIEIDDVDNEFYTRFCSLVEKELSDQDLSVDSIAGQMGLGRTQFYRKIKALTNYSPVELLRNMRLSKARMLLMTTDKSISEIAYEVGFSTPAYFGKCYKDRYGETPSEIREH